MLKFVIFSLLVVSITGMPQKREHDYDISENDSILQEYLKEIKKHVKLPPQKHYESFEPTDIKFHLYTSEIPKGLELIFDRNFSLWNSSFDPKIETVILIHDYYSSERMLVEMISAYLMNNVNVITVSYERYAGIKFNKFFEVQKKIGKVVAEMIRYLYSIGVHPDTMHIIGQGTGAHIAASAANILFPLQVGRITGLDPTGLDYDQNKSLEQLNQNSSVFVDVISTNSYEMGSGEHRGNIQFYPNVETGQLRSNVYTDHMRAYQYFVESIMKPYVFKAYKAKNHTAHLKSKSGISDYMGHFVSRKNIGSFYLDALNYPPYGGKLQDNGKMSSVETKIHDKVPKEIEKHN